MGASVGTGAGVIAGAISVEVNGTMSVPDGETTEDKGALIAGTSVAWPPSEGLGTALGGGTTAELTAGETDVAAGGIPAGLVEGVGA